MGFLLEMVGRPGRTRLTQVVSHFEKVSRTRICPLIAGFEP